MLTSTSPRIEKRRLGYPICGYLTSDRDGDGTVIIPPSLKDMVGFLHWFNKKTQTYEPLGTAFYAHVIGEATAYIYVITCKHVVEDCINRGVPIFLRINDPDNMDVFYAELRDKWVFHEDESVDLAVLELTPETTSEISGAISTMGIHFALLTNQIAVESEHTVKEGDEVVFLGLFAQYIGTKRNFPVFRFGHIALVTDEKIRGIYGDSDYLVIESQAYPGFSGSPLFIHLRIGKREAFFLLGVVAAFYPDQSEVFIDKTLREVFTHYGISLAVPAEKIMDIIDGKELSMSREKRNKANREKNKPHPAALPVKKEDAKGITKEDFEDVLRKIARPLKPDDPKKKGT